MKEIELKNYAFPKGEANYLRGTVENLIICFKNKLDSSDEFELGLMCEQFISRRIERYFIADILVKNKYFSNKFYEFYKEEFFSKGDNWYTAPNCSLKELIERYIYKYTYEFIESNEDTIVFNILATYANDNDLNVSAKDIDIMMKNKFEDLKLYIKLLKEGI